MWRHTNRVKTMNGLKKRTHEKAKEYNKERSAQDPEKKRNTGRNNKSYRRKWRINEKKVRQSMKHNPKVLFAYMNI